MSTQRGNSKKGTQKYQNKTAFKNDLHDRTPKMQMIKNTQITGACQHCKEVIEWKIKYRKYKPLTTAKKCTKCQEKKVKQAYFILCVPCLTELQVCGKCGQKKEVTDQPELSEAEQMSERSHFEAELQQLTERERRQFLRLHSKGKLTDEHIKEGNDDNFEENDISASSDSCSDCEDDKEEKPCSPDNGVECTTLEKLTLDSNAGICYLIHHVTVYMLWSRFLGAEKKRAKWS